MYTVSMSKTNLFQTIQVSISTQFSSIWFIDRTLSGATILGQSEPGSDGNGEVLRISQSSCITGTSPSDCLVSYPGHSLGGGLHLCREAVGIFYSTSWMGKGERERYVKGLKISKHITCPYQLIRLSIIRPFHWMLSSAFKQSLFSEVGMISLIVFVHIYLKMVVLWTSLSVHYTWFTLSVSVYLSLPPTRQDLTQGQKPEGRLKWG